ncbi:ABC transporter substrate-binding protein [Xinfangfangia sp. D13-10-4-6]|uniref:ABC transporter substrate-binding protein n=1 Tax=Pseudogemmobacter hezensis TaxID=2737662 RepID=UPI001552EA83|nr:ABC transporter substrate-binding protein [Pseudogemmobacter hezensis]NPD17453.1 ABC transporter substrate-binding protein [Pseudogemmobacter hezensis]
MLPLNRRNFLSISLAAGALPVFAPAAFAPAAFAQSAERPELRIAVQGLPVSLEPVNAIGNVGNRITNAIFDTLIRRDFLANDQGSATDLVPAIAASWAREDDRTLLVTIAEGVRFHNGRDVTARDVAFSFSAERIWGDSPMVPRGPLFSAQFESVEAIDDRTVRMRTTAADWSLEKRLASWIAWVVPEKEYREMGPEAFGLAPIGTGPYKFVEFVPGDRVVLEAFDDYYLGRPTASRVTFSVVPEIATRVAGLISGEYEMACALGPDNIPMLSAEPEVEARATQIENVHLYIFQCDAPVVSDKRVRRALNLALDRDLLNKALWGGLAGIPNGFQIPAYGAVYDASRPGFAHDPELARSLLAEAGYAGEQITFRTLNDYYVNSVAAIQMMMEMWKSVGLNVDMQILENWNQVLEPGLQMRNWSNGFQMPDASTPLTSDWGPTGSAQTLHKWQAPVEYNELAARVASLPDGEERAAAYARLMDIWEDEAPGAVLYRPVEVYGVRRSINWRPVTFEFMDLRPYNLTFDQA